MLKGFFNESNLYEADWLDPLLLKNKDEYGSCYLLPGETEFSLQGVLGYLEELFQLRHYRPRRRRGAGGQPPGPLGKPHLGGQV